MNRTLLFLTLLLGSVAFAQDVQNPQTNASQLTTGTVASARGGAGTITGALKGNGAGVVSQAACADLSNAAASCATDATNASNLASGAVPAARMPALTGDCTTSAGTVATTCTKINGVDQTAAWTSYSPTITAGSGTFTSVTATEALYKVIGKTCHVRLKLTLTTIGSAGISTNVTLPVDVSTASAANGVNTTGSVLLSVLTRQSAANTLTFVAAGGAFGWTSGDVVYIFATYETP